MPENQLHEARELYNAALQERRDAWKVCRESIHYYDQAQAVEADAGRRVARTGQLLLLPDVLRRLDKTFQAFFARVRRGEKPGFPRFRSFRRYDSITFPLRPGKLLEGLSAKGGSDRASRRTQPTR